MRGRETSPQGGWMSEAASSLALAGFLGLVFVAFTLLALEPLAALDAYLNLSLPPRRWLPVLQLLDRIGQRAVCLPVLALAVWVCCRRRRSWRPALLAAGSVMTLNLLVLALKVGLGRGQPAPADPSFFVGGMAYPSGHTANIVLVYGLAVFLLGRYVGLRRRTLIALWSAVGGLSVLMVVVSATLSWHWFADLIAGLLVGAIVLELTVAADAAVPGPASEAHSAQGAGASGSWQSSHHGR
ncbi:phosphatase PAP2 family protein [soil metagenome]